MALSWNEIRSRAVAFSKEWENEASEDAEAKSFWDAFFNVFGVSRRLIATFEQPVRKLDESMGYIDLLWKGTILVEHKSRGKDLDKAYKQALDYFPGLKDYELPKYVLVSDFGRFRLYDLDEGVQVEFELKDFYMHIKEFGFIAGYQKQVYKEEDPVNILAAELMGKRRKRCSTRGRSSRAAAWPICTIRSPCPRHWSKPTRSSTKPWIFATAPSPSPTKPKGSSTFLIFMRNTRQRVLRVEG